MKTLVKASTTSERLVKSPTKARIPETSRSQAISCTTSSEGGVAPAPKSSEIRLRIIGGE